MSAAATEGRTLREQLEFLGEQAVSSLGKAGIATKTEFKRGYVSSAIEHTMAECNGDLVILGAQGHGFLERLLIGSVALNQVVTSRFSTLVIRSRS